MPPAVHAVDDDIVAMTKYIAFLRGINVGGNSVIKMAELKKAFESLGFKNVKTVLASGNVIFESSRSDLFAIAQTIGRGLEKRFGWIPVIVRTMSDVKRILRSDPFKGIRVTPDTRLYVTFLSTAPAHGKSGLKIPYESTGKELKILKLADTVLFSALDVSGEIKTPNAMNVIEKEFGNNVTTRNWNTILKIARL